MKKLLVAMTMGCVSGVAFAAANSSFSLISNFETRSTGAHAIYLVSGMPTTEGCTYNDRAVVVEGDSGTKTMTAMLVYAMANSKQVQVRVSGCTQLQPGENAFTAPKVVKVQVAN